MEPRHRAGFLQAFAPLVGMRQALTTQIGSLLAISAVLGLAFNASNPIGIRLTSGPSSPGKSSESTRSATPTSDAGRVSRVPSSTSGGQVANPPVVVAPAPESRVTPDPHIHSEGGAAEGRFAQMTWWEAKPLIAAGRVVLVDARGTATFEAGHIPGAVSLPEGSGAGELQRFAARQGTNQPVVVYCGNSACDASTRLAEVLVRELGYTDVRVLAGGYAEWQRAELGFDPTPTRVTWGEVRPLVEQSKVLLVDARPRAAYDAGHIPGAVSLPESSPETEFQAFQKQYGAEMPMVVYCTDLKCSKSMRVAVKLATWYHFRKVQFMPGGYQEWQESQHGESPAKP